LYEEPAGAAVTRTEIVNESEPRVFAGKLTVIGVTCAVPTDADGIVPTTTDVGVAEPAALAGATDVSTPRPKAATATSATRLKVVFVDICFLSISRVREFPDLGFG
jgi:hypothetical protein